MTVAEIEERRKDGSLETLSEALEVAPELIRHFRRLKQLTAKEETKGLGLVKARLIERGVFK